MTEQRELFEFSARHDRQILLVDPPGCSSTKSVTSHTLSSTTIQQSSGVLCFDTSLVDRSLSPAIFTFLKFAQISGLQDKSLGRLQATSYYTRATAGDEPETNIERHC
jgi:hypothetical protein